GRCDAARQCCLDHLESWIEANPPMRGINWASGIEIGLRTLSITLILSLLQPETIDAQRRRRLVAMLAAHGRWLARYPARFSSANNHLVAEAAALFVLGSLLPRLPAADRWRTRGRAVLVEEVDRQFLDDGVGAEQSPTYGAFSLELFALAGDLAERLGAGMPDAYWRRLEAAAEHLRALLDRRGGHPRIGDDDEGRVVADPGREATYVGSVLAMLGAMRGRPDLAPPWHARALRNVLLGAVSAHRDPPTGVRRFPAGGYTISRSRVGASADGPEVLLVIDHGPLGYLRTAAHGHADALALWLHVDGEPVLVDAGTYRYYDAGTWRDRVRGTAAHNTLCLGGVDSSRPAGRFNWSEKARVQVVDWTTSGEDAWSLTARHDGYRRRFGCDHERIVRQRGRGRFEVVDRLLGAGGPWPVEIGFLVAPGLRVVATAAGWEISRHRRPILAIAAAGPLTGSVRVGSEGSRDGWYSGAYGELLSTRRLVFSGDLAPGDAATFTLLAKPMPDP
ncbi:MAG TPA: alginate lyase family protein, partial [Vicinamibacterales bacterium]|nr:alginate lyase family protein [Vicinamibacterales bacterium]